MFQAVISDRYDWRGNVLVAAFNEAGNIIIN